MSVEPNRPPFGVAFEVPLGDVAFELNMPTKGDLDVSLLGVTPVKAREYTSR